jgi:hypothetical protein
MKKTIEAHGRLIDGSFFTDAHTADYFEEQRETEGETSAKKWFLVKSFSEDAADEDDFNLVARSRLLDRETIYGVFLTDSQEDISDEEVVIV